MLPGKHQQQFQIPENSGCTFILIEKCCWCSIPATFPAAIAPHVAAAELMANLQRAAEDTNNRRPWTVCFVL